MFLGRTLCRPTFDLSSFLQANSLYFIWKRYEAMWLGWNAHCSPLELKRFILTDVEIFEFNFVCSFSLWASSKSCRTSRTCIKFFYNKNKSTVKKWMYHCGISLWASAFSGLPLRIKGMFELISRRGITCWGLEVCSGRLLEASNSRAFKLTKVECRPCIPPTTHGYHKRRLHKLRQSCM